MGTKIKNKKMSNAKNNITIFPESKPLTTQPKTGFLGMGKVDSEERKDPNQGVFGNIVQNDTVNLYDYADIGDLLTAYNANRREKSRNSTKKAPLFNEKIN